MLTALRLVRGVVRVEPVPANINQGIAEARIRSKLLQKVTEVFDYA